mgnify:CR=1 FL=1
MQEQTWRSTEDGEMLDLKGMTESADLIFSFSIFVPEFLLA